MTLEDFFTLTEMKDGFATPSRVEELLCVMKKEKDFVVKNVSDATRQWTAVASTIAATENKECLDLFIRLDGLWFLDKWLKDALGLGSDTSESFVEESITAMLRALEKLHIDTGTSISTGICITVKNLLRHNSSRVQDIARVLFDSWKGGKASGPAHHNIDVSGASKTIGSMDGAKGTTENGQPECLAVDVSVIGGSTDRRNDEADPATIKNLIRNSSIEVLHQERGSDSGPGNLSDDTHSHRSGESAGNADTSDNQVTPLASKYPQQINSAVDKKLPFSTEGGTACSETLSLVVSKNEVSDSQNLNDPSSLANQKSDGMDSSTGKVERAATSCGSSLEVVEGAMLDEHAENKAGDPKIEQPKATPLTGLETPEPDSKNDKSNPSSKSHDGHECREVAEPDELDTIISRLGKAASGDEDKDKKHSQEEGEGLRSGSRSSRKRQCKSTKRNASYDRASDLEFDYGIIDPLEVARNIAQEVEREVVDHRELSYSSSEELSGAGNDQPSIPDSNVKHDVTNANPVTEASRGSDHSTGAGSEEKRCKEPERGIPEIESSQVTVAQELEPKMEKSLCGFDLNQEFSSDDMEHPVDSISTPSVVSASRAAAAPGLPVAPLQFEGTLGWKGSAATSAFRPASPRRNSDSEKNLSGGGTSSSSKHRMDSLDIDLNVIECEDEKAADVMSGKQVQAFRGHQSPESSLELSSRRPERLKLDLNRTSDDGDAPPSLDNRIDGHLFCNRNGHRSLSPASSSSSMQLSLRNIDLNDRPIALTDASDLGHQAVYFQNVSHGGPKPVDPVISIMGTRVEVNQKGFIPPSSSLLNGKAIEIAMDTSVQRSGGVTGLGPTASYTHSPFLSHNGLTTGTISGSGDSIPYMVDSRGAAVVPQIVGSASAVPSYSQLPFIMSMSNTGLGLNVGPLRSGFDLNSGFVVDGANRDSMGRRLPAQARSMEEHLRANSQPSSSTVVGVKRKEPDTSWEHYPFNYRHQQFPWKQ